MAAEGSSRSPGGAPNWDSMCIDLLWPHTENVEEGGGILYKANIETEYCISILQHLNLRKLHDKHFFNVYLCVNIFMHSVILQYSDWALWM